MLPWLTLLLLVADLNPAFGGESSSSRSDWHYGATVDLSYALDFNFPENHRWRNKATTPRVNELAPNMILGYVRKDASEHSRWGMELGAQSGYDTDALVPNVTPGREKPVDGADTLRHISRANMSYLAPVGNGLTLTAGLFNSFIGYQSFYAKNNINYTRSYMADNAPYFMFGLSAIYPITDAWQLGLYVINGYNHLSRPNDQPSYGTQVVWKPTSSLQVIENFYYGPDQSNTSLQFWRLFSDSIVEWKDGPWTLAFAYDIGTESAAEQPGYPCTFWTGGALYGRWNFAGPWSLALRPEFYWDRNGRISGSEQLLKAMTTTLEYRVTFPWQTALLRLEHRYDESSGVGGGFFKRGETSSGTPGLAREQHLLLFSVVWSLDK
ncbi:MAG: porin [Nitrospira sp.]|nr:porin [Nitrospira sp.]